MDKFKNILKKILFGIPVCIAWLFAILGALLFVGCIIMMFYAYMDCGIFDFSFIIFGLILVATPILYLLIVKKYPKIDKQDWTDKKKKRAKILAWVFSIIFFIGQIVFPIAYLAIDSVLSDIYYCPCLYGKYMQRIEDKYNVTYFPYRIPKGAKNVKIDDYKTSYHSSKISLSFNATDDYIKAVEKEFDYAPVFISDNKKTYKIIDKFDVTDENYIDEFKGDILIDENTNKIYYRYSAFFADFLYESGPYEKVKNRPELNNCGIKLNYKRALDYYNKALRRSPLNHRLYTQRAEIKMELNDKAGAIKDLKKAKKFPMTLERKQKVDKLLKQLEKNK